ncbi:hypothetical protein Dimus_030799 [Dionaea muscipula]
MEDGDGVDVSNGGASEVAHLQVKECEIPQCVESSNNLESQRMIIPREGNYTWSSTQEFIDLLDGKNINSNVYFTNTLEHPCSSSAEDAEGRVQELTLTSYSLLHGTSNMQPEQNHLWLSNQQEHEPETGSSLGFSIDKDKVQEKSSGDKMGPSVADPLISQPSSHQRDRVDGQLACSESKRQPFSSSEGMRTKIIPSSGFPEYFVKSTLKGKGVLCRSPSLVAPGAHFRVLVGNGLNGTAVSSDESLGPEVKCITVSTCKPDESSGLDSCSMGDNLREWMNSESNRLKVSSLSIFRQILDLVNSNHLKGKVLLDFRPSFFKLSASKEIIYCGRLSILLETPWNIGHKGLPIKQNLKMSVEQGIPPPHGIRVKRQKNSENVNSFRNNPKLESNYGLKRTTATDIDPNVASPGDSGCGCIDESYPCLDSKIYRYSDISHFQNINGQHLFSVADQLEENWYRSPEELVGRSCTFSSNIYSLGVLLFELLSCFDPGKTHATAMSDLRRRILPPKFLSENPKEAGFCLWLLHPEPSLRPTSRDILQSEVISGFQEFCSDDMSSSIHQDESESEILLLHFLSSMKEQKHKHATKLEEDVRCIEADIKEVEKRHLLKPPLVLSSSQKGSVGDIGKRYFQDGGVISNPTSDTSDLRFVRNVEHLEGAYFSVRSNIQLSDDAAARRPDRELLENRENLSLCQKDEETKKPVDRLGAFFDGLCKYARYRKLEVCGTLKNGDFTGGANVICSLSFDRDEDYLAAAGALCDDSVDIHYPATEMTNKSKISCICWNSYIRNYLASTDYDGVVKLWDASIGKVCSEYSEHVKRAWSVDFSRLDPMKFASGSDDCSVKLWSINERNCLNSIRNIANVCCVQFSSHSSHMLAFGSADYKICCYDLRNANIPWCILSGHEKAVSYVKFLDSETLVSASTDNTLKLWDLTRSSSIGLSTNACSLTLRGHTNEKNFVGLSVADGYIACGSETNEVYSYYKSFPTPITSHKFGSIDPISGNEVDDDSGQFVSCVCWRGKSNVIVAANSSGCIKVLRMV